MAHLFEHFQPVRVSSCLNPRRGADALQDSIRAMVYMFLHSSLECRVHSAALSPPPQPFVHTLHLQVKPGDKVLYFKYAGDNMSTPEGEKYVVLREDDILCKA